MCSFTMPHFGNLPAHFNAVFNLGFSQSNVSIGVDILRLHQCLSHIIYLCMHAMNRDTIRNNLPLIKSQFRCIMFVFVLFTVRSESFSPHSRTTAVNYNTLFAFICIISPQLFDIANLFHSVPSPWGIWSDGKVMFVLKICGFFACPFDWTKHSNYHMLHANLRWKTHLFVCKLFICYETIVEPRANV